MGGLALWWNRKVEILIWDKCQIGFTRMCKFLEIDDDMLSSFTHTSTDPENHKAVWSDFKQMIASINYLWAIIGDLNMIEAS